VDRRNVLAEMTALLANPPVAEAMTPELEAMMQKLRDNLAKLKAMQAKKPKPKTLGQAMAKLKSIGERNTAGSDDFDLGEISKALDQFRAIRIATIQKAKTSTPKKGRSGSKP
jgi:hypothetical protein